MNKKRAATVLVASSVVLFGSVAVADAAPARPATVCGGSNGATVSGGTATWRVSCSGGTATVSGSVRDTKADGLCAQVHVIFANGASSYSPRACPAGQTRTFSLSGPTYPDGVSVYLELH